MPIYPGLTQAFEALQHRRLYIQELLREVLEIEQTLGRILFSSQTADDEPSINMDNDLKMEKETNDKLMVFERMNKRCAHLEVDIVGAGWVRGWQVAAVSNYSRIIVALHPVDENGDPLTAELSLLEVAADYIRYTKQ